MNKALVLGLGMVFGFVAQFIKDLDNEKEVNEGERENFF